MSNTYNILWIDDQYEELEAFVLEAESEDIYLDAYKSFEEGFSVLESNLYDYDGVILDAMFFESKDQEAGSEDLKGLKSAVDKLNELKHKKKLPFFLLSGQTRFNSDTTFKEIYGEHYRKGNPDDIDKLFQNIKEQADNLEDTQLKHKHQTVLNVCVDQYIGRQAQRDLLAILKYEHDSSISIDADKFITPLRKIIEDLFRAFNKFELIPDKFIANGNVSLNPTSRFLAGETSEGYTLNESSKLPKVITGNLWSILDIVQNGSHRGDIDSHLRFTQSPYLLFSTTYQLLDLLVWFKKYIDSAPDKSNWTQEAPLASGWLEGKVDKFTRGGDLIFKDLSNGKTHFVPKMKFNQGQFLEGDDVKILGEPDRSDPSKLFTHKIESNK